MPTRRHTFTYSETGDSGGFITAVGASGKRASKICMCVSVVPGGAFSRGTPGASAIGSLHHSLPEASEPGCLFGIDRADRDLAANNRRRLPRRLQRLMLDRLA